MELLRYVQPDAEDRVRDTRRDSRDRHHSLVEIFPPNENERSFYVARVFVQKVIQLTALHPSRHRVLCLDGIANVHVAPHPDAPVPQYHCPEVYVPDCISCAGANRNLPGKEERVLERGNVRLKR